MWESFFFIGNQAPQQDSIPLGRWLLDLQYNMLLCEVGLCVVAVDDGFLCKLLHGCAAVGNTIKAVGCKAVREYACTIRTPISA